MKKAYLFFVLLLFSFGCIFSNQKTVSENPSVEPNVTVSEISSEVSVPVASSGGSERVSESYDPSANLVVYFLPVSHGGKSNPKERSAILIKKGNYEVLIGGGDLSTYPELHNFLLDKSVKIELLVCNTIISSENCDSHKQVVKDFQVDTYVHPPDPEGVLPSLSGPLETIVPKAGDSFDVNGATLTILYPPTDVKRSEDSAISFLLTYKDFCMILPGESPPSAFTYASQKELLPDSCDVIELPEYGSKPFHNTLYMSKYGNSSIYVVGGAPYWKNEGPNGKMHTLEGIFSHAKASYYTYVYDALRIQSDGYDFSVYNIPFSG